MHASAPLRPTARIATLALLLGLVSTNPSATPSPFDRQGGTPKEHANLEKGVALSGYDPVAYFPQSAGGVGEPRRGKKELTANLRGVVYRFSSEGHRARFLADPERPEGRLLQAIVLQLAREVEADGARFRLFVLPSREDLSTSRRRYLGPTLEVLEAAGVEVHDLTGGFVSVGAFEDDAFWAPGGHYSAQGNGVVAGGQRHLLAGD